MNFSFILTALLWFSPATETNNMTRQEIVATELPTVEHRAFMRGEKLSFEVSYGWLDAGEAEIEIMNESRQIAGREVMHVVGTGVSKGTFNWFFKVRDRYETYMDEEGVFPWVFVRDIHEGGFELKQYYTFDQYEKKVTTDKGKEFDVPLGVQDMISSFYRARTFDFSKAQKGQIYEIQAFVDNEVWPLKIKYLRNERKKIDLGTFDCMLFVPVVQTGRIFKEEEDMKVWVTRDENKIPILAEASVLVGSINMELTGYKGLRNRVSKVD